MIAVNGDDVGIRDVRALFNSPVTAGSPGHEWRFYPSRSSVSLPITPSRPSHPSVLFCVTVSQYVRICRDGAGMLQAVIMTIVRVPR